MTLATPQKCGFHTSAILVIHVFFTTRTLRTKYRTFEMRVKYGTTLLMVWID